MTATTTFRMTQASGLVPSKGTYGCATNVLILGGTMVSVDADGRADVITNGQNICGVAVATIDNRTTAPEGGAADALKCDVAYGVHGFAYDGTAPEPGDVVYALDNQTVTLDSNSGVRGVAGYCSELREGLCWVYISPVVSGEIAAGRIQHRQLVVDESDITAAAATETLSIGAVLPANATILGVTMHTYTPFTGGTISDFTVDIGSSGDADALVDGADLFSAAVDGAPATMTAGVNPNKTFVAAGAQLTAKFDCASDDVADATAGAVTIDVLFTVLA